MNINTRVNCMNQSNRSITINKLNEDFLGKINIQNIFLIVIRILLFKLFQKNRKNYFISNFMEVY